MTYARRMFCLLIMVTAAILLAQSPAAHKDQGCTEEDYAVYAAAFHDLFGEEQSVLLIDQTSMGIPPGMAAVTQFGAAAQSLYKQIPEARSELESRNQTSAKIDAKKIKVAFDVIALGPDQAGKALQGGGWKAFHKRYPIAAGITLLSLPGFSMGHDRALLYVGRSCDLVCGNGLIVLLGKEGPYWKVLDKARVWIS
jgi:hypothetical protein